MKRMCTIRRILLLSSGKIHTLSMSSGALKNQPKQRSGRAIALQAPPPPGPCNRNWFLLLILTTCFGPVFDNFVNCSLFNWQFKFKIHAQVLLLQFWYSSYYWAAFSNDLKKMKCDVPPGMKFLEFIEYAGAFLFVIEGHTVR